MSEKIFALFLRLYPARFRARYGEESLQLLRDRLRDETGLLARLRLAFDLLTDTALALPRAHRISAPSIGAAAASSHLTPSFRVLEQQPLRPGAIGIAGLLSAASFAAFVVLLSIAGTRHHWRPAQDRIAQNHPVSASAPPAAGNSLGGASTVPANASASAGAPAATGPAAPTGAASLVPLDPAERHRVVAAVATDLETYYFDRSLGQAAAQNVLFQENHGADDAATSGSAFAVLLTQQIRTATGDLHLIVDYSANPLPPQPVAPPSPRIPAAFRAALLADHCGIERAAVLPGNIGYLRLNAFPPPEVCAAPMRAAMASLNHTAAVIFDLRDNRGGDPAMVALVASYLFPRPQPWYNPREAQPSTLPAPFPAGHLANAPVYILTSVLTISGAEQFSYNLRMLHRATLIGETTAGSAHIGVFHRIDDHFGIGIPAFRPINPYATRDWEVVGVAPDVEVRAADALSTAQKLAATRLRASSLK